MSVFVRGSTFRELEAKYIVLRLEHMALMSRWNKLVGRINEKGGEAFLEGSAPAEISDDDIRRLLQLCHPDKHDGKAAAVEMTQKLLSIRDGRAMQ